VRAGDRVPGGLAAGDAGDALATDPELGGPVVRRAELRRLQPAGRSPAGDRIQREHGDGGSA
jgi:hypothetical protein